MSGAGDRLIFGDVAALAAAPTVSLVQSIEDLSCGRVLIVGDVMLDEYLLGDAERISPEAPVPVVLIEAEKQLVGGAANVARNIAALGGQVSLVGVKGPDMAGERLLSCLMEEEGIACSLVTLEKRPTTVKTRVLARQQQVVRIDREDTRPLPEAALNSVLLSVKRHLPECGAMVISDYGKGLVSGPLMEGLRAVLAEQDRPVPVLVDPKPQNSPLYKGAHLLTPNTKETGEAASMSIRSGEDIRKAGARIMERLDLPYLLTTLGPQGMALFEGSKEVWHIPTTARQVFDVTGAGDTVIATVALGIAAGLSLLESCLVANYAAGIVVGEVGAATATPNMLAEAVATLPRPVISPLKN